MAARASILQSYKEASLAERLDIICKNYPIFLGIVDSSTDGLIYVIENEKAYNKRFSNGDTGVRVQKSRSTDTTADTAINNVMTRDALIACDFSGGVLDGTDRAEEFKQEAFTLQKMRADYDLFNSQLKILKPQERQLFVGFISREMDYGMIADEIGSGLDYAVLKIHRAKMKIKGKMIDYLEGKL